jgi:hypothetical protein
MANEFVINGIRTLWQEHEMPAHTLSVYEVRSRARKFHRTTQRWNVLWYVSASISALSFARFLVTQPSDLIRLGAALGFAAILLGAYFVHKGRSAQRVPEAAGLTTCINFHRAQLVRQRDFLLRSWRYLLLPIPGAIVFVIGASRRSPNLGTAPIVLFIVLSAVFIFGIANARALQAHKLQREIDALNAADQDWR